MTKNTRLFACFITFLLPLHRLFAKRVLKQYENIRVVKEPTECRVRFGSTRKWARQMGKP